MGFTNCNLIDFNPDELSGIFSLPFLAIMFDTWHPQGRGAIQRQNPEEMGVIENKKETPRRHFFKISIFLLLD